MYILNFQGRALTWGHEAGGGTWLNEDLLCSFFVCVCFHQEECFQLYTCILKSRGPTFRRMSGRSFTVVDWTDESPLF